MPFYSNPHAQVARNIDEYPVSFGLALATTFSETWMRSVRAAQDFMDSPFFTAPFAHEGKRYEDWYAGVVSEEKANEQGAQYGLKYGQDTHQSVIDRDIQREKERYARELLIRRGPDGGWANASYVATSFVAEMVSPINLPAAFIPIAGPAARIAGISERALVASTRNRIAAAAFEGAAGNMLVEPLEWAMMSAQHRDYTLGQTMNNFLFGLLAGAAFRGAGEVVSVPFRRAARKRMEAQGAALVHANIRDAEATIRADRAEATISERATALQAHAAGLDNGMRPVGAGHVLSVVPERFIDGPEGSAGMRPVGGPDAPIPPDDLHGTAIRVAQDMDSPKGRLFGEHSDLERTSADPKDTVDVNDPDALVEDATTIESVMSDALNTPEVARVLDEVDESALSEMGLVKTDEGKVTTFESKAADDALAAIGEYEKAHKALINCLANGGDV